MADGRQRRSAWCGCEPRLGQIEIALIDVLTSVNGVAAGRTFRSRMQTAQVPSDIKPTEESLGTRQIEGVKATGRRSTIVIPAGRIGNDRAIQIVEEQWDSPELNMVMSSRFSDPRTGVVEYRLTNVSRTEPRADLFVVPADYTVTEANGGGRGGRGGWRRRARAANPGRTSRRARGTRKLALQFKMQNSKYKRCSVVFAFCILNLAFHAYSTFSGSTSTVTRRRISGISASTARRA